MKRAIQVLAFAALLAASVQAALPKNQMKLAFSGGSPIPLCDPSDPSCKVIN